MARHKARIDSCLEHVVGYFDTEDPDETTYKLLGDFGLLGRRIANQNDAWFFSPARYRKLVARLGVDDFPDCSGLVEAVRRRKSPREIAYLREAGRYCAASARGGDRGGAPRSAGDRDLGPPPTKRCTAPAASTSDTPPQFVAGPQAGLGFECAGRRPVAANDVVYMEAGGTHNRYNCMLSRTVIVGRPDPKWTRMAEASREALEAAKAATRAGVDLPRGGPRRPKRHAQGRFCGRLRAPSRLLHRHRLSPRLG